MVVFMALQKLIRHVSVKGTLVFPNAPGKQKNENKGQSQLLHELDEPIKITNTSTNMLAYKTGY